MFSAMISQMWRRGGFGSLVASLDELPEACRVADRASYEWQRRH
jgi:hypothetical protein